MLHTIFRLSYIMPEAFLASNLQVVILPRKAPARLEFIYPSPRSELSMRHFLPDQRKLLESLEEPLAIYDCVDGKAVTLLVSDGLCKMKGLDRESLMAAFDESMFETVHPDDAGKLAHIGAQFARRECGYDVVYRERTSNGTDYHLMHTVGHWQACPEGGELAFLYYTDMSRSIDDIEVLTESYTCAQGDVFYNDPVTGLPNFNYF